jgi:hypothetical protein
MLIQKGSREDAIRALINIWLKDKKLYCGWCGTEYTAQPDPCCERPYIADNSAVMKQFLKELREQREDLKNKFGSNKTKDLRLALSFPPGLLQFLEISFQSLYQEKLITKEYPITWFAKKFKMFTVPKEF